MNSKKIATKILSPVSPKEISFDEVLEFLIKAKNRVEGTNLGTTISLRFPTDLLKKIEKKLAKKKMSNINDYFLTLVFQDIYPEKFGFSE